jgi:hypothetical protein
VTVILMWQHGDGPGEVGFVVSEPHADNLLKLLEQHELKAERRSLHFRSAGSQALTTVVTTAENPAAWAAVGVAVKAFLDRHKGKEIRLDEEGLTEAKNYSARDIERIVKALSETNPNDDEQ